MSNKRAVFFCSAINDIDPKYKQAAHETVRAACLCGYDIVSGGTLKGLMKIVSDEAISCGAKSIGVIPEFMKDVVYPNLDECFWTSKMSERKDLMRELSDVAIALPGGIGTIDEISETYCLLRLKQYSGKIILYNLDGFYNSYRNMLEVCVHEKMLSEADYKLIHFVNTVEELKELL